MYKNSLKLRFLSIARSWYVWLFPVFALAMCAWLVKDYYEQKGSTIEIVFDEATNLQPEKTKVKFKGVTIGTVKNVSLSEDNQKVIASVVLIREAKRFAMDGTKYWIVTPKINLQGVSGLDTLLTGSYIAAEPTAKESEQVERFVAQEMPDEIDTANTSAYILETDNVEAISVGDSVSFRGLKVGSVTRTMLTREARSVLVQINVENKYARTIRTNTVFWKKPAVYAKFGLFGGEFKINSFDTIMNSGIEFVTPDGAGAMAKHRHKFILASGPPKGSEKWSPNLSLN